MRRATHDPSAPIVFLRLFLFLFLLLPCMSFVMAASHASAAPGQVAPATPSPAAGIHWSRATVRLTEAATPGAPVPREQDPSHPQREGETERVARGEVTAEIPFVSLGVRWLGGDAAEPPRIEVRGSPDGTTWSAWVRVGIDDDMTVPASGEFFGRLIHLGSGTRIVQYTVGPGAAGVEEIELIFIDPGPTPAGLEPERAPTQRFEMEALAPPPPIVTRTDWGCPDGQDSPLWPPEYTVISHLIVHHTTTTNAATDWPAEVRSIWTYHALIRGWYDIGYNFLIDPNGVLYEGRAGGVDVKAAHFSCQNSNTMGVALLGDYETAAATPASLTRLAELLAWRAEQAGLDPLSASLHPGTDLLLDTISGHRDGNPSPYVCSTAVCPGDSLYGELPSVRSEVEALLGGDATAIPGMSKGARIALGLMLWGAAAMAIAKRLGPRATLGGSPPTRTATST